MITTRINANFDRLDRLERDLPNRVDRSSYDWAVATKQYMMDNWSSESPSLPGNAPAKVTGNLENSIQIVQNRNLLGQFSRGFTIRVTADYAMALEYGSPETNLLPRPFFHIAVARSGGEAASFFRGIFDLG